MTLCFASNNEHKLSEIKPMLAPGFTVLSLQQVGCNEELPETAETIKGNSEQKAQYVFRKYHVPCFADDTGLEVPALGNAPGVFSARYAGPQKNSDDNIRLLLQNLNLHNDRSARFRTVITLASPDGMFSFEGILDGQIIRERRGHGGFGYDPVFRPSGFEKTLAEMDLEEKNRISHRAIAVQKFVSWLRVHRRTVHIP